MTSPTPAQRADLPSAPAPRRGPSRLKLFFWLIVVPLLLAAAYFTFALRWNYSTGERAGWVQKFSKKGWICKTWEGEMAMVTMPGSTPEKFPFTVWDDAVAAQINRVMGKRVTVHYEEKVGLPTTCFGETRHFVTGVGPVEEIPLAPGIVVPVPGSPGAAPTPGAAPQPNAPSGSPAPQDLQKSVPPPAPAPAQVQTPTQAPPPAQAPAQAPPPPAPAAPEYPPPAK